MKGTGWTCGIPQIIKPIFIKFLRNDRGSKHKSVKSAQVKFKHAQNWINGFWKVINKSR